MKKKVLLSGVLMLMSFSMAQAQKAYTYVQQGGSVLAADGTAAFDLSSTPTVEFVDGKAVMTVGSNQVAVLPMGNSGQLTVEFENNSGNTANSLPVTVTSAGYGTVYSPFQLQVPSESSVKVYAPTYDADTHELNCVSSTEVAADAVIPAGTALLLKNAGDITFGFSDGASTDSHTSVLSGSALAVAVPTVESSSVVFTLGYEIGNENNLGFFEYIGSAINEAKAYLVAGKLNSEAKYIAFNFNEYATAISNANVNDNASTMKYVENGRVVIVKNGQKFNINGQSIN